MIQFTEAELAAVQRKAENTIAEYLINMFQHASMEDSATMIKGFMAVYHDR